MLPLVGAGLGQANVREDAVGEVTRHLFGGFRVTLRIAFEQSPRGGEGGVLELRHEMQVLGEPLLMLTQTKTSAASDRSKAAAAAPEHLLPSVTADRSTFSEASARPIR